MRKRYGFCFLALFFIPFAVSWAQDSTALTPTPIPVPVSTPAPASPSTPDSLEHSMNSRPSFEANIAESDLAQAILQNRPVFEEQEVRLILDDIEEFNRKIRTNLATIDQEIQKLRSQKQDWIRQKDVVQQLMRLDSLKDSRGKIYAETEKVLKNMNQVGIYLVVLDGVDPYASKEQLRALAKATLTPQAISELVGTFVQSSTEVRNNMLWKDLIRTVVSGRLEVEEDPVAWPMKKSGRFVYVARVKVHPQEKEGALDSLSTEGVQAKLIKAMPNPEVMNQTLQSLGIDSPLGIEKLDSYYFSEVANRNQNTQKSLDRAINDGNKRLQAVDADIQKILNEVATVKANLQLQTLPDSLLSDSINGRIASADSAIALACIRKLQVKSHEFIVRPLFPVISESEPPNDIARAVIGALRQQQESQGKVENFFEQSIVENMMLVDLSHMRSRDIFRVAERFWMFPVLNDDDSYRVAIVTRFRLTDDQDQPIVFPDSVQSESPPEVSTEQESPPPPLSLEIEPTENTSIDDIDMNIENDPPNHLSWQRKVAIALWGVSIGGVAGGYYMNIKGDGYQDDFEQAKQNQNADELRASSDNLDKAEKYRNISYGTSIGTFVLGLIFWISGS